MHFWIIMVWRNPRITQTGPTGLFDSGKKKNRKEKKTVHKFKYGQFSPKPIAPHPKKSFAACLCSTKDYVMPQKSPQLSWAQIFTHFHVKIFRAEGEILNQLSLIPWKTTSNNRWNQINSRIYTNMPLGWLHADKEVTVDSFLHLFSSSKQTLWTGMLWCEKRAHVWTRNGSKKNPIRLCRE